MVNPNFLVAIGGVVIIVLTAVAVVTLFSKMTLIWFAQASRAAHKAGTCSVFFTTMVESALRRNVTFAFDMIDLESFILKRFSHSFPSVAN